MFELPFSRRQALKWGAAAGLAWSLPGDSLRSTAARAADEPPPTTDTHGILEPGSKPERLLEEGAGEGPAWDPDWGLLFSGEDGHIRRLDANGKVHMFRANAGSNGLLFNRDGNLLVCEPRLRRVTRMNREGELTVLTDNFEGKKYNQPNDITVDSQGRVYFSDPRYGDRGDMQLADPSGRKIEGVYRIDADGKVTRIIAHEVDRPNGVLVTPDDRYLYVADNNNNLPLGPRKLWRFDLRQDGTVDLESQRLVYDWGRGRGPDGMVQDEQGRIYVAGGLNRENPPHETVGNHPGGVYVFDAEGKYLLLIPIPVDEVTNCTFGGEDLKTLYVTAGGTLWTVRTRSPGKMPWPKRG